MQLEIPGGADAARVLGLVTLPGPAGLQGAIPHSSQNEVCTPFQRESRGCGNPFSPPRRRGTAAGPMSRLVKGS